MNDLQPMEWEQVDSWEGTFMQRFAFAPPPPSVTYRVLRDEWDDSEDVPRRTILEIEVIG